MEIDGTEEEVKRRIESVKGRVGEDALNVLREHEIDIDAGLSKIVGEQVQEEDKRAIEREIPITSNMMTSELVYRSESLEDLYGKAFESRLRMIGLDDEHIKQLYQDESSIISKGKDKFGREQPWAGRYFFMQNTRKEDLPELDELTLSELILITDDANSAFWRDHHTLSPEAWQAVCFAATCAEYTEAKYAFALLEMVTSYGLSKAQEGAFIRNDSLLLERLKWGNHQDPAWTTETTNLKTYER